MNKNLCENQKKFLAKKLSRKTVLISGATGLIGSRIVNYLLDLNSLHNADIKVIALYRDEEKKNAMYVNQLNRGDLLFCRFLNDEQVDCEYTADYIIHCAGISGGSKMHLSDPTKIFEIGINLTRTLLEYAVKAKCQSFVYVSTYELYGSINSEEMIDENHYCCLDPLLLRNSYAEVKRLCEAMGVAYSVKYGIKFCSGRLTSTFGTGVAYNDSRFFAEFARCIIENRDIVLKSRGETVRNYLDSDDAASAFLYILVNGDDCNAYNVTNMSNAISIKDIALKMIDIAESNVKLVFDINEDIKKLGFRKEGTTLMSAYKLEELGWSPVYAMDETLFKLIKSMKGE